MCNLKDRTLLFGSSEFSINAVTFDFGVFVVSVKQNLVWICGDDIFDSAAVVT